jgi:hypothetical protein
MKRQSECQFLSASESHFQTSSYCLNKAAIGENEADTSREVERRRGRNSSPPFKVPSELVKLPF